MTKEEYEIKEVLPRWFGKKGWNNQARRTYVFINFYGTWNKWYKEMKLKYDVSAGVFELPFKKGLEECQKSRNFQDMVSLYTHYSNVKYPEEISKIK